MARYPQTGAQRFRTIMGRCRRVSRTRGTGHAPGLGDWADPRQLHGCWAYPRKLPGVPDIPQTIAWGMRGNPSNYLGAVRTTRFGTKRSNDTQPRARQSAPAWDTHGWHDGRITAVQNRWSWDQSLAPGFGVVCLWGRSCWFPQRNHRRKVIPEVAPYESRRCG